MTDYSYPNTGFRFGQRDAEAPGSDAKIIRGVDFDPEFDALVTAIASKLNWLNPQFEGEMTSRPSVTATLQGGTY